MFERVLRKIQEAIRAGCYSTTDPHFAEELAEADLSKVDVEAAILTGKIIRRQTDDPRGVRYTILGGATDGRKAWGRRSNQGDWNPAPHHRILGRGRAMKAEPKPFDYGKCDACATPMVERVLDQTYHVRGKWVLVRNIPSGICPRCGERSLRAEVLARVERVLRSRRGRPVRIREVDLAGA